MKRNIFLLILLTSATVFFVACNKAPTTTSSTDFVTLQQTVIKDFTNNVALAQYSNLTNVGEKRKACMVVSFSRFHLFSSSSMRASASPNMKQGSRRGVRDILA